MENQTPVAATHEEACQRVAAHFSRRWLRRYVKSKLRTDPVFVETCELLRNSRRPLLDVGCGMGLLSFYLRERGQTQAIIGLDLDGSKIRRGNAVARDNYKDVELREQDVAREDVATFCGDVAVFDLLHYLAPATQRTLLQRLTGRVPVGGLFLIRDAPRDPTPRFCATFLGEIFAQSIRWNVGAPLHFPRCESIHAAFSDEEWRRDERPCWGRTPFNNRLFIFQRRASATAPAPE